jgi:hypothetical protein
MRNASGMSCHNRKWNGGWGMLLSASIAAGSRSKAVVAHIFKPGPLPINCKQ